MPVVPINQTTLNYRWDGPADGAVVMLAHSLAADLTLWDGQVAAFKAAGFRVLRYDLRGHGRSAVPDQPCTMATMAADAVGLMDHLGLAKVHFLGLSLGGMVGQVLGTTHGNRLHSLVLCSTAAHMPPPEIWEDRIQAVRSRGMRAVVDATVDRWITAAGQQGQPETVQRVRSMILETPPAGFASCCAAIRDLDLRDTLRTIMVPTLILVGEHDQGTPVPAARLIHERIATSQLMVVADAAHLVNIEQAVCFNQAVVAFLRAPDQLPSEALARCR